MTTFPAPDGLWLRVATISALAAGVLAACGSDPTEEAQASLVSGTPGALSVAFDGSSCSYDGPAEVSAGTVELEAVNNSDSLIDVAIVLLDDSATIEEFIEFHQPEPSRAGPPDFARPIEFVEAAAGEVQSRRVPLEAGDYGLVCLEAVAGVPEGNPSAFVVQQGGVTVTE